MHLQIMLELANKIYKEVETNEEKTKFRTYQKIRKTLN